MCIYIYKYIIHKWYPTYGNFINTENQKIRKCRNTVNRKPATQTTEHHKFKNTESRKPDIQKYRKPENQKNENINADSALFQEAVQKIFQK